MGETFMKMKINRFSSVNDCVPECSSCESECFRIGIFRTIGAGGGLDGEVGSLVPKPGAVRTFSRGPT